MKSITGRKETPSRAAGFAQAMSCALCVCFLVLAGCRSGKVSAPDSAWDPDSIPDAFARPVAALQWPFSTRAVLVGPDGSLDDGAVRLVLEPSANGVSAPPPRRIASERRWRPVVRWRRQAAQVRFDFEAVALPGGGGRDTALIVSLGLTATNEGAAPAAVALDASLSHPELRQAFVAWDDGPADRAPRFAEGVDTARAWTSWGASGALGRWEVGLAPGARASARLAFASYPMASRRLTAWARQPHAERVGDVRRFWDLEMARAARFELGDPEVEDALRAAWVVLLACRERRGADEIPIGGLFQYRDVWVRDAARAISALSVSGFTDEAVRLARGLGRMQTSLGAFVSQRSQLDAVGQAPWAMAEAALRSDDGSAARDFAPLALAAWRWREGGRTYSTRFAWPLARMFPVTEPRDNEFVRAQLVGNDAWALAGYEATTRLLRAAGRPETADSVASSRAAYVADFQAALARTGRDDVPPSWQGKGHDWGNLSVAWPCRVLPASDPHVELLARRKWAEAGGAGLCTFAGPDSLHGYAGAELGVWALLAGRRPQADSVLDALLQWRNGSGAGGELIRRSSRDFGTNLPPHPSAAAALVAQIRWSLLADDDDTLRLTLGARERWWKGSRIVRAPTRWGRVDLAFRRDGDAVTWTWTRVPVWSALTLPAGTRLAGSPSPPLLETADGRVLAPPGVTHARVTVATAGARQ